MAAPTPEDHPRSKADRAYDKVRWLGPLYTMYKIVKDLSES